MAAGLAALVVLIAAVAIRAATESVPAARAVIRLASTVRLPGPAPVLAWPATGQAALAGPTGPPIGSFGAQRPVPIASLAKVMTAYLILQDHPLDSRSDGFTMTITAAEAAELPRRIAGNQSVVSVHAGQELTERAALEALLLPSADNIADDLAAFDSGSLTAFVARMNSTASTLGMSSTHFADASGVDSATVSDASDLIALARAAMGVPAFAGIVALPSATVPGLGKLRNYNTLVGTDGFTGVKTGSTISAGQALMFSATRSVAGTSVPVVGVVLEQHGSGVVGGALAAAKTLVDSYYPQLQRRTVLPAGAPVATVTRVSRSATLSTTGPLQVLALPGATVDMSVSVGQPRPGWRSATVQAKGSFGRSQVGTNAWRVPSAGAGWRLSHLL